MQPAKSLKHIKTLYDRGTNVMELFREMESSQVNSLDGILAAYDLQAGSYVRLLKDPQHAAFVENYTTAIARILDAFSANSMMEAGVGEATTLVNVLSRMRQAPLHALGFDISWSRLAVARKYAAMRQTSPALFIGNLTEIPIEDNAIEVVYTSHSIEPNRGREKQILAELFRVTGRYLVLLEPSNELGSDLTRRHIDRHKYCFDLYRHAQELGFNVIEHRLFDYTSNPSNQTALMVIAKPADAAGIYDGTFFACPRCRGTLVPHNGNYFCGECLVVYPVLCGIPCLLTSHAVLATRYLDEETAGCG